MMPGSNPLFRPVLGGLQDWGMLGLGGLVVAKVVPYEGEGLGCVSEDSYLPIPLQSDCPRPCLP